MRPAPRRRASPVGPILAIVGGAAGAVASAMDWVTVTAQAETYSARGLDTSRGKVVLVAGVVTALSGAVMLVARKRGFRLGFGMLAAVAALVGLALSLYDTVSARDSFVDDVAAQVTVATGLPPAQSREAVRQALDAGVLDLSVDVGLWLVVAGSALGVVGGIAGTASAGALPVGAPAPPPPLAGAPLASPLFPVPPPPEDQR